MIRRRKQQATNSDKNITSLVPTTAVEWTIGLIGNSSSWCRPRSQNTDESRRREMSCKLAPCNLFLYLRPCFVSAAYTKMVPTRWLTRAKTNLLVDTWKLSWSCHYPKLYRMWECSSVSCILACALACLYGMHNCLFIFIKPSTFTRRRLRDDFTGSATIISFFLLNLLPNYSHVLLKEPVIIFHVIATDSHLPFSFECNHGLRTTYQLL